MRHLPLFLIFAILLAAAPVRADTAPPFFRPYKHPVTTWVPPYAVADCKARLQSDVGMSRGLTHLALQFWLPTEAGGVERVKHNQATDAAVIELRDWAHAHGIRAMLCVYNHRGSKWDWTLARAAFTDNKDAFVNSLVAEMHRLQLDGIDIDL